MTDPRVEKLADLLVNYSVAVQPGQKVWIRTHALAEPLAKAVYTKVLQAGGLPYVQATLPGFDLLLYRYGSAEQIQYLPAPMMTAAETCDAEITLMAEVNTKELSNIDPSRLVMRSKGTRPFLQTILERAARKELKWTLTLFPNQANAQDAEMSLEEYENFVYSACLPDMDDPVGFWKKFSARQEKIIEWLKGKQHVHVIGPETDLRLSIAGRPFINCDCHENVPDGEIFTGPVEDSVEGQVYFSYPAIYNGHEVTGVRLWFEGGKVVKAAADKNEEFLIKTLDTDEGSRRVGEFAIGTNPGITRFTGEILFDEKIGGSFHMALGAGYPETGSSNESAIHWDMICDLRSGGEIWVDDQLLYQNGNFAIDF